jgi:hypothetical protein
MEKYNSFLKDFFNQQAASGEESDIDEFNGSIVPTGHKNELVRSRYGSIKKLTGTQNLLSGVKPASNVLKLTEDG